jgi:predicted ester cyclase/mannose-6-phosphate isomerase-like protein (cupin superfamily)
MIIKDLNKPELMGMWVEGQTATHWGAQAPFMMGGLNDMIVVFLAIEPGMVLARHVDNSEELITVLAGQIVAEVGDETAEIVAGQLLAIPPNTPHSFHNTGTFPARLLSVLPTHSLAIKFDDTISPANQQVFQFGRPVEASKTEQNKQKILEFYHRSHRGDLTVYDEMFAPDFVSHGSAALQDLIGPEAFKQAYVVYETAFPDFRTSIDQIVAEGDYVMVRGLATGTHLGSFMGLPATGKKLHWTGFALYRFNDAGLICERWQDFDGLKLMGELGVIPNLYTPG